MENNQENFAPSNGQPVNQPVDQVANQQGFQANNQQGYQANNQQGYQANNQQGYQPNNQQGFQPNNQPGYQPGNQPGYQPNNQQGYQQGYQPGYQQGYQPAFQPGYQQGYQPKPDSNMVWAILSTLFCCLPLGIVAIVNASKVDSLYAMGDYAGAEAASNSAKKFAIYSAIGSLVFVVLYFLFLFFVAAAEGGF